MIDYEEKYLEIKGVVQEFADKQGHDRCHYYPELFRRLIGILEVNPRVPFNLPSREDFRSGCQRYEKELYEEGKL